LEWVKKRMMEKVSARVKEKDLKRTREMKWVSAKEKGKAKAGDFLAWFASKRLLQLKPKLPACL
jgi:hypothetical protein